MEGKYIYTIARPIEEPRVTQVRDLLNERVVRA